MVSVRLAVGRPFAFHDRSSQPSKSTQARKQLPKLPKLQPLSARTNQAPNQLALTDAGCQADTFQKSPPPPCNKPSSWLELLYPRDWAKACPPFRNPQSEPLLQYIEKTDPQKLKMAQALTDWTLDQVVKSGAKVAVIARGGSHITKTQDKTWMEHTGILYFHPQRKQWEIYNLLNANCNGEPVCDILRSEPLDFFYSQPNMDRDALLMIPSRKLQEKMQKGFESGEYKKLQFTNRYNLITHFDSPRTLNCNKWVLMNLVAAKIGNYNPQDVLDDIQENFQPSRILVCPLIRPLARQHPTIWQKEAPLRGPIRTVTAESLYRLENVFDSKQFYSGKSV